jgi:hypothetical protein
MYSFLNTTNDQSCKKNDDKYFDMEELILLEERYDLFGIAFST